MKNPHITAKERNLLKGAVRRVFSRSDIRKKVIEYTIVYYNNTERKRVKTWCKCQKCLAYTPKSYMVVDHIIPIIGITETLEDLSWDTLINRLWCDQSNLMALCDECHTLKTKEENKLRREHRKRKNESK